MSAKKAAPTSPLDDARHCLTAVEKLGDAAKADPVLWAAAGGAERQQRLYLDTSIAYALVSIAESLDRLVGIPPCPHCGSRAGATDWSAVEVDEHDPATWHRRCVACGGVLPEFER